MGKKPETDNTPRAISVEVLYRDQQCGLPQAQTRWLRTQPEYHSLFRELRQSYMGDQALPPPVDWSEYGVLLVAMGQKNTGGYGLALDGAGAALSDGVLGITLQWREPQKGMMVTQVLTSPCILLKVPKSGFDRIEIKDQSGAIRLSSVTPHTP